MCIHERDSLDGWPPLSYPDGRTYGIQSSRIFTPSEPKILRICEIEVVQRGCEYSYWDFLFQFYESAFERGAVNDDCKWLLNFARHWLERHFEACRVPPNRSGWGYPFLVVID